MTHDERIQYHMYETYEGIAEHAERIVALEELVRDVVLLASCEGVSVTKMQLHVKGGDWRTIADRMRDLGIEVDG